MGIFFILWGFNWLVYEGVVACFSIHQTFWINYFVSIIWRLLHYYTYYTNHSLFRFSIQLYEHQKLSILLVPYFAFCSSPCFTAPSFSVRKYVYFVHTILIVYLTILYTFIASAQGGAALAPRPPQSTHGLRPLCIYKL